ncbi:hypothetical protein [Bifidobacterium callitrichos]|uniref:EpsP n=1 Tax=Bifidobacterium callitrichos DSM 23973 TaxID=1437609 RepID=A0A087A7C2_9BIFI|nr:hypothetical protein [Bifidobacterium callitrichos]KFI54672.1 EpsP [Bifidobacterium callitrichos DSM 23973]
MELLISFLHAPTSIRYINDFVLSAVVISLWTGYAHVFKKQKANLVIYSIFALLVFDLFTSLINFVQPQLVFWALRNTFRGILYFLSVAAVLYIDDIAKIFGFLFWLQIPNILIGVYQWRFLDTGLGDEVHGIFATGAGANMFSILLVAYYLNEYLSRRENLVRVIVVTVLSIFMAVIGEEKTAFVYLIVVFIISLLVSKWSLKTLLSIFIVCILAFVMFDWIETVRPSMLSVFLDMEGTEKYLNSTWSNAYGIPRIGAFTFISSVFFKNDIFKELFGLGFGNCEYSQLKVFQSDFAKQYIHLEYRNFVHQWTFLETGYIGFSLLIIFFSCIIICLIAKRFIYKNSENASFNVTSICIALCCIVSMWSNNTIKYDSAFLPYFGIALGFLSSRK